MHLLSRGLSHRSPSKYMNRCALELGGRRMVEDAKEAHLTDDELRARSESLSTDLDALQGVLQELVGDKKAPAPVISPCLFSSPGEHPS